MMISEALRLIRVFHDLKQGDLAERLELSKSFVSELENGHKTPSVEVIQKYAKEFGIPPSSILFFAEQLDKKGGSAESRAKNAIAAKVLSFLQLIERKTT
jgi:transcriptional regulator with XRE-family HTH domain